MRWLVPMVEIERNERCTSTPSIKNGRLRLWDKNSLRWSAWRIIGPCPHLYALIVERGYCPKYWNKVIYNPTRE